MTRLTNRSVLSEDERNAVLNLPGYAEQVRSNHDFVKLGERVDHSCLIVAGVVGRFDQDSQGNRQIIALHIPGDMADLHSAVQPEVTSALQALSTTTIVRIPHSAILSAARTYPTLGEALWRDCMADSAILAEWVFNVGRRDAKKRIAHLICEIAVRVGAAPANGMIMFPFPLTQTHVGDAAALTPVHVNRTVQALRREGLVDIGKNVKINDWGGLVAAADFDDRYLHLSTKPKRVPLIH
ncbi:Crp/Fnr family transcriptional regulator [Sphingomonas daechungensis]|uniref:Crp/Fnr family transcriptional regulator n=1 Tax=Sphingomonas daechungensis TaxID=1176646 RepID=UPI0031EC7194